jgi:heme exporter protein D
MTLVIQWMQQIWEHRKFLEEFEWQQLERNSTFSGPFGSGTTD